MDQRVGFSQVTRGGSLLLRPWRDFFDGVDKIDHDRDGVRP
jgi:hypothetical protein